MTSIERLQDILTSLSLTAIQPRLESLLEQAAKADPSYGDFLLDVLTAEQPCPAGHGGGGAMEGRRELRLPRSPRSSVLKAAS